LLNVQDHGLDGVVLPGKEEPVLKPQQDDGLMASMGVQPKPETRNPKPETQNPKPET
jgi:hypothetical protein